MLLSSDVRPESTVYFCGGNVLKALKESDGALSLVDLYEEIKRRNGVGSASFLLALDWLFLLGAVRVDEEGTVTACS